jgi:hypothetical protein
MGGRRKGSMSTPISAMMTSAVRRLMPRRARALLDHVIRPQQQ